MARRLAVIAVLLVLAGCSGGSDSPSGPSASSIVIELEELVPAVASGRFCSVRTVTRNLTRRDLTLTYRWRAFNAAGNVIGTALDFIGGLMKWPIHSRPPATHVVKN